MEKVKLDNITYHYVRIKLEGTEFENEDINVNIRKLYLYIDKNYGNGTGQFLYGNAFRAIKKRAQEILSRGDIKISKREVASLMVTKKTFFLEKRYIRIPYKLYYIFKAVFEISDELKDEKPLPSDLASFVGMVRRECFYNAQCELYKKWYNRIENQNDLTKGLNDEIFAGNSILSQRF